MLQCGLRTDPRGPPSRSYTHEASLNRDARADKTPLIEQVLEILGIGNRQDDGLAGRPGPESKLVGPLDGGDVLDRRGITTRIQVELLNLVVCGDLHHLLAKVESDFRGLIVLRAAGRREAEERQTGVKGKCQNPGTN